MTLDDLMTQLQAIRTDPHWGDLPVAQRGQLPVTATAPGAQESRPVTAVDFVQFQFGASERVSLTVNEEEAGT
jgi:hypothetical protein